MKKTLSRPDRALLAGFFRRNGYTRWQDARRKQREGYNIYKKGDEVRLVAESLRELALVRRLLRRAGFRPGRPFRKGNQYRQPLYGRQAVARFLTFIGEDVGPKDGGPTA
ncbi:MAG TPA: hypothetical protein VGX76_14400 [Pirellulales bacterium]|jgi:hypothetical protein|nr:hypothetical protein [Pirellulales bacterium]